MARFFLSRDAMDLASGVIPIAGDDAHHIAFSIVYIFKILSIHIFL